MKKPTNFHKFLIFSAFLLFFAGLTAQSNYAQSACIADQVLINEIYTEGGLTGAAYKNDYVELFNVSTNSCNLTNFSIQVASGNANNFPNVFAFPSGSIIPGRGFFLIKFGSGGSGGAVLPTADFTAVTDLTTSGKIALVSSPASLTGNCASNLTNSIDYVGYGTTNCSKGAGPAPSPTASSSIERLGNGYNTNNNNVDFALRPASPRNTVSPTAAAVTISGILQIEGNAVPCARIYMTNQNGETRITKTNQFGRFQFKDVPAGETILLNAFSKYGEFYPLLVNAQEDISDLTFEFIQ